MKLLVSDYDYSSYEEKDSNNIKNNNSTIKRFISKGNIFAIATEKPFNAVKEKLTEYEIPYSYLISQSGSAIFDSKDKLIYFTPLDENHIFVLLNYLRRKEFIKDVKQINFYGDETYKDYETTEIHCETLLTEKNMIEVTKIIDEIRRTGIYITTYIKENKICIVFKQYMHKAMGINNLINRINLSKENVYTIDNDLEEQKEAILQLNQRRDN